MKHKGRKSVIRQNDLISVKTCKGATCNAQMLKLMKMLVKEGLKTKTQKNKVKNTPKIAKKQNEVQ